MTEDEIKALEKAAKKAKRIATERAGESPRLWWVRFA
jgi:hypothetical protein